MGHWGISFHFFVRHEAMFQIPGQIFQTKLNMKKYFWQRDSVPFLTKICIIIKLTKCNKKIFKHNLNRSPENYKSSFALFSIDSRKVTQLICLGRATHVAVIIFNNYWPSYFTFLSFMVWSTFPNKRTWNIQFKCFL